MPSGIVKNGVILQVLGGTMRKFKTCSRRSLPFRLLVILAGAFLLLAAFAPRANADLLRYYDFEGPVGPGQIVDQGSHAPAIEQGELPPFAVLFLNDDSTQYNQHESLSRNWGYPWNCKHASWGQHDQPGQPWSPQFRAGSFESRDDFPLGGGNL